MKRDKDEKIKGPMFPRLHVNDTEKKGPRAPPRNKMALYEQFSIPSQRFNHSNNKPAEPPSNQGVANERDMFSSYQLPTRHQSEKPNGHYSEFTIPFTQVNQRKKLDEDDFRVPIFVQNRECGNYANDLNREKLPPSDPSNFSQQLNSHKIEKMSRMRQEVKSQNSKEFATNQVKATSLSNNDKVEGEKKQPDSSMYCELRDSSANCIDRLDVHDVVEQCLSDSQHDLGENIVVLDKINSSVPIRTSHSDEKRGFVDIRNEKGYQDKSSLRSVQTRNLERVDSVSETSVVDSGSRLEITPDEVVDIIGLKHFWKARKAIVNQQRVFAVQVFELHRLVKVQRLIAEAPQILADNSAYLGKPTKVSPRARIPSNDPIKAIMDVPKQKDEPEKPKQIKENSAAGKPSFSSIPNGIQPPTYRPLNSFSPAPSFTSNPNAMPWCFSQPQGQQWLIPVMTPSEGLVYKPYPGPGFSSPDCAGFGPTGPGPMPSNFLPPVCGIPAPHPQYPLPHFPPAGAHSYFPSYAVPMMNGATFSSSSVEQNPQHAIPSQPSAGEANPMLRRQNSLSKPSHKNRATPDESKDEAPNESNDVDSRGRDDTERMHVLPLFPMSPATGLSPHRECPIRAIKVVPHNGISATESAARIFQSIQEERKQFDSM